MGKVSTAVAEQMKAVIVSVAQALGVDPKLALATAQQESGFDPNAIGDSGHSVGLFQLNDRGEGAGMTVAQREDPAVNARIALTQIANVARDNPGLSPGEIAAAAQRPLDRVGYARSVNAIYSGTTAPASSSSSASSSSFIGLPTPGDVAGSIGGLVDQFNPFRVATDFATSLGQDLIQGLFRLAVYGTLLAAGGALVVLGGWRAVSQSAAYQHAKDAAASAGQAAMVAA